MSYKKSFTKIIQKKYPLEHQNILKAIQKQSSLISQEVGNLSNTGNPLDKRMDFAIYFLALIQTMETKGLDYETIKQLSLEITYDFVKPKNKFQSWLKQLPPKLAGTLIADLILDFFNKKINKQAHPQGFVARIITDKKETFGLGYGIDIIECGICKLFNKFETEKYVPILCEVDKVTSDLAGLELIRNQTIAEGADKCDFRFKKK